MKITKQQLDALIEQRVQKILKEDAPKPIFDNGNTKVYKTVQGGISISDKSKHIVFLDKNTVKDIMKLLRTISDFN